MKLRALELDQFKKFDRPVRIDGFGEGLNLLVGPNETGKSTVLAALRAVLFEKHRSGAQSVRDLQHFRHRTAPEVALDFEIDGGRHRVEKRFVARPMARLTLPNGRRIEGDEAEEHLARLLGVEVQGGRKGGEESGAWGVLLAGQGASLAEPVLGGPARRTLQACLEAEVGDLIGSRQSTAVLSAIEGALSALVTPAHGRPTGRYRETDQLLERAADEIAALEQKRAALTQEIEQLEAAEAEHQALATKDAQSDEPLRLQEAAAAHDELSRRRTAIQSAENALERARLALERAETSQGKRRDLKAGIDAACATREQAQSEADEAARAAGIGEALLSEARGRVAQGEEEHARIETRLQRLDQLHAALQRRDDRHAALDAAAPEVALAIEPGALAKVAVQGQPIPAAEHVVRVVDSLEITVRDVGRFVVRPQGDRYERLRRELAEAERGVKALLGEPGLAAVRRTAAARVKQLELGLGARTTAPPDQTTIAVAIAEARAEQAQRSEHARRAREQLEEQRESWHRTRAVSEQAVARLRAATARRCELEAAWAQVVEQASDEDLVEAVVVRRRALGAASAELAQARAGTTDEAIEEAASRVRMLASAIEQRRGRLAALRLEIDRLGARIQVHAGEGLEERLAQASRRCEALERERESYRREVEVLTLLRGVLVEAERAAKDRYLAPLVSRVATYLEILCPGAAIDIDAEFKITALTRDPTVGGEPLRQLSHGTREQIAVICRLAFAELLADQDRPAVVVLDDALAFSDDERLDRMFEALERAARRVQILVLTCRQQTFQRLKATRLSLVEVERARAAQA